MQQDRSEYNSFQPSNDKNHTFSEASIGFRQLTKEDSAIVQTWKKELGISEFEMRELNDPDFVRSFREAIPDVDEQRKYLKNTSNYLYRQAYDQNYVLIFRRTLPFNEPKPEQHWTDDYIIALRGLRLEISGAERLHSVILCAGLGDIISDTGYSQNPNLAESDGEIKVDTFAFNQQRALFTIKPENERTALERYLQQPDAISLEDLIESKKKKKQPISTSIPIPTPNTTSADVNIW